ncbi:MAG: hypothetical protein QME40_02620 [bacterium]|nr:hypothetical protein [bacterium]
MANKIQEIKEDVESLLRKTDEVVASNEAIADEISHLSFVADKRLQELCSLIDHRFQEIIDKLYFQ